MEPVLPNRLRHPVIREDVWTIDHISCMLSDASRRLLEDILGPHVGYINPNGSYRPMCVTVAYSRSLIELYWFTRNMTWMTSWSSIHASALSSYH